jgi:FHA domain
MTNTDNQLFTVEEALSRLGENREQGCLLVCKGAELIHIFVQDGFVVRAYGSFKEAADAVGQALHLKDSSYTWLRGIQPPHPAKNSHISIVELTAKYGNISKPKMIATSRLAGAAKKEGESKFKYFLVPEDRPTEKLYLTKSSTVMGRDKASDLFIDNSDVSWRHCLLDIQARGVSVLDLNSTNGTFVNGTLVQNASLDPGDRIELGPCMFTVNREPIEPGQ